MKIRTLTCAKWTISRVEVPAGTWFK